MGVLNFKSFEQYKSAGYTLIPLHPWNKTSNYKGKERQDGKRPIDTDWTNRLYKYVDVIKSAKKSGHNVGVRLTAEQLVIDVDPRNMPEGRDTFAELCEDMGLDYEDYPFVETGSGGLHVYMTKPAGVPVVDTVKVYDGVEFKTKGRQVVAAGSKHPNGKMYNWDFLSRDLKDAGPVPDNLLNLIRRPDRNSTASGGGEHTPEEIAAMLEGLDPVDFQDQFKWLNLMMACHHASNGDARLEFIEWSISDPKFADESWMIGRRWDSLHRSKGKVVTYKSLHKLLREKGQEKLIPIVDAADDFDDLPSSELTPKETADIKPIHLRGLKVSKQDQRAADTIGNGLSAVAASGLMPAYNELKQSITFLGKLPWDSVYGSTLDENTQRLIRHYLIERYQGNDYQPSKDNVFEAATTLAYQAKFNPVIDYLNSLKWDGTARIERLFIDGFPCGEGEYQSAVSRCFMIGAVARQMRPGCKVDTMPVIQGDQGSFKSTGLRVLFSDEWFSDAELGDLAGKDASMLLSGVWVHEFAELAGIGNSAIEVLKAFMSRATDRIRPPYGKTVVETPRRAVFAGTTNEGGIFRDHTGARRFWPLKMPKGAKVNIDWIADNRMQLWAEAFSRYNNNEPWILPPELMQEATERQAYETILDPWADEIEHFLARRADGQYIESFDEDTEGILLPKDKVHSRELFEALGLGPPQRSSHNFRRVRRVMESLGWTYKKSVRIDSKPSGVGAGYQNLQSTV